MKILRLAICFAGLMPVVLSSTGCASSKILRREKLVPDALSVLSRHSETLHTAVICSDTCSPYADQPPNGYIPPAVDEAFVSLYRDALTECIRACQLYRVANSEKESDLVLSVALLRLSGANGFCGANETPAGYAILVTRWTLTNRLTGQQLCQKDITTAGEHGASDYILGGMFSAQRNAIEEAAAANIRQGVEWLGRRTHAAK